MLWERYSLHVPHPQRSASCLVAEIVARGPCAAVEVTSPSTARIDRGEKVDAYRRIPTLRAYLIIDHRRRRVERHWRATSDDVTEYDA